MRKSILLLLATACFAFLSIAQIPKSNKVFSVTACPAENTTEAMNFSWATIPDITIATLEVTTIKDKDWKKSKKKEFVGEFCATYDNVFSKDFKNADFYEDVKINKYNAGIDGLKKNTQYKYRVIAGDTTDVHYFKTSGSDEWSACFISDFHTYSPQYSRTTSAMQMIDVVEAYSPFEWILNAGDVTTWGGSYTFWKSNYTEQPYHDYMWAGVNGNHDNVTRDNMENKNFFRDAAFYPRNGYKGQEGVCYYFYYGEVLFIMLNTEDMRKEEGFEAAKAWLKEVVKHNPARYRVVVQHYQWFNGNDGKAREYDRWSPVFDEVGIDLALSGNNHIYISSYPLYNGQKTDGTKGTVYVQSSSSDNVRGRIIQEQVYNTDKIKLRWSEGTKTMSAMHLKVEKKKMVLTLLNREGKVIDTNVILAKKR